MMLRVMSNSGHIDPEFEYANEIYDHLRQKERQRRLYTYSSPDIDYRDELIKYMRKCCKLHRLTQTVEYLSIYILDFFMDNHSINDENLELTAICCITIAAKVDERDNKIPKYRELMSNAYSYGNEDVYEMETIILQYFDWNFLIPTQANYIDYFCTYCFKTDTQFRKSLPIIEYYLEKSLDNKYYKFKPSLVAASCIYCARESLNLLPVWPKFVQNATKYTTNQIKECVSLMKDDYNTFKLTNGYQSQLIDSDFIQLLTE